VVSSKINIKPRIKLRRSIVSLQKVVPSLNTSVERRILPSQKLSSFSDASIEKRIATLEMNVALLAKSINKEADLEKKQQRENEKNLKKQEENKLRSGEEKQLEKKLSKSVLSPVKKMGSKAGGIFEKLKSFFMLLLGGWLTNQGLDTFIALANGDNDKLESIKNEVIKTLAIVGGIFLALNVGILGIVGTIGKIALAIALAPFKFAFRKLGELLKPKPKPSTTKPDGGKQKPSTTKPGGGIKTPGSTPGTSISPGNRAGSKPPGGSGSKSTFALEQERKANTQKSMLSQNKMNPIAKRFRSLLARFETTKSGRAVARVVNYIKGNVFFRPIQYLFGKALAAFEWSKKFFSPKGLQNIGNKISKVKILGRLLGPLLALVDVTKRARSGMSPAQAIIPALFKGLLTSGGAALGGLVPIPGVNILTSIAGGIGGNWLGDQMMNYADNNWNKSWDNNLFKGFNNTVMSIGEKDPSGLVSKIFPYEGEDKKYGSTQKTSPPTPVENPSSSSPTTANVSSSESSMPSAPNPVTGDGNTTVIYKKIGSSGGQLIQGQPLKTGSATDVPLIASENPSNFYTMYSQILYNVVI